MVRSRIVQGIVYEPARDLLIIAPVGSVNGLPGIDIVIERKSPNRVRQNWDKPRLEIINFA